MCEEMLQTAKEEFGGREDFYKLFALEPGNRQTYSGVH